MKRLITIGASGSINSKNWGFVGEKDETHLMIEVPEHLINCDYLQAELAIKGKKHTTDNLDIVDGYATVVIPFKLTKRQGRITAQLIGYVADEDGNIGVIGKSNVFEGDIFRSVEGVEDEDEGEEVPTLLQRIWTKMQSWADKIHTHSNKELLDTISADMLKGVSTVSSLPAVASTGDICLYSQPNVLTADDSEGFIYFNVDAIKGLTVPEGYVSRAWSVYGYPTTAAELPLFSLDIQVEEGIVATKITNTSDDGKYSGTWIWIDGELDTDLSSDKPFPDVLKLGGFVSASVTKILVDDSDDEFEDSEQVELFHCLPKLYAFDGNQWRMLVNTHANDVFASLTRKISRSPSANEITVQPNTEVIFTGEATSLTIKLAAASEDRASEYWFSFISGAVPTTLTLPASVKWGGGNELTVEANKRYEVSIVDNIGLWCAVEVSG